MSSCERPSVLVCHAKTRRTHCGDEKLFPLRGVHEVQPSILDPSVRLFPKYQRALTVPYDAPDQRKHLHAVYIWLQPLDVRHVPDKFRLSLDGRSNVGRTPLEGCPRTVLLCLDDGQSGGKRVIPQRLRLSRVSMGQVRNENIRPEPRGRLCPAGQSIPHRTPGRRVAD